MNQERPLPEDVREANKRLRHNRTQYMCNKITHQTFGQQGTRGTDSTIQQSTILPCFKRQSKPRHLLVVLLKIVLISVRTDEHDLKWLSRCLQRIVRLHQLGSETTAGTTPMIWITAHMQRCVSTQLHHPRYRRVVATKGIVMVGVRQGQTIRVELVLEKGGTSQNRRLACC